MASMRVIVGKMVAAWVIVIVAASAVMTCVPGAMQMRAAQMPSCAAMHDGQPCLSSDFSGTCCVTHDPSLVAARDHTAKAPLESVTAPWLALAASPVLLTALCPVRINAPPGLRSIVSPPPYILLSTLRV